MAQPTTTPVKPDLLQVLVKYAKAEVAAKEEAKRLKKEAPPPVDGREANRLAAKIDAALRWKPIRYVTLVATTRCECCEATWQNFLGLFIEEVNTEARCLRKRRLKRLPDDNLPRERLEYSDVEIVQECPNCIDLCPTHHQLELPLPVPTTDPDVTHVLDKVLKALGIFDKLPHQGEL